MKLFLRCIFNGLCVTLLSAAAALAAEKGKILFETDTVIRADLDVPEGTTLVIKPGVRVIIDGYFSITVHGLIIAEGEELRPIIIAPPEKVTKSRESPAWKGLEITGKEAQGRLKYCTIQGAYRNLVWESSPSFENCTFSGNHYGLYCAKKGAPAVKGCSFTKNTYGIAVDYSYPLLLDNTITGNVIGLYLQLTTTTIAGKNKIIGNDTDIKTEKAYGKDSTSFPMQGLWNVMQQLY